MTLYQLAYVSSATTLMDDEELFALLQQSRQNNKRENITGLLLYKGGNFIQVLEGPEEEVKRLHEKISKDHRHRQIITLFHGPLAQRNFSDWAMGFQNLDKLDADAVPEGFSDFLQRPLSFIKNAENPSRTLKLLLDFKRTMR